MTLGVPEAAVTGPSTSVAMSVLGTESPLRQRQSSHRDVLPTLAVLLLLTASICNIWTHIPWRDEIQALLIARDTPDLRSLIAVLHYEGHPALWHLLLRGVTVFTDSPVALKILQTPITVLIFALVWFKSPFTTVQKLLLLLGYHFVLEYTVVARGYGLGVLIFFAFLASRGRIWAWIFLGLLANTSVLFGILAGICAVLLFVQGNRKLAGMAAFVVLAGFAAITAYPAPDAVPAVTQYSPSVNAVITVVRLSSMFLPIGWRYDPLYLFGVPYHVPIRAMIGILAAGAAVVSLHSYPLLKWAFIAFLTGFLLVSVFVFTGYDRHFGLLWIALIGMHWMGLEDAPETPPSRIFTLWAGAAAVIGPPMAFLPLVGPFSGEMAAATWLRENARPADVIAAYPAPMGISISAWLDRPTYNLQASRWNTFITWDFASDEELPVPELAKRLRDAPAGELYLVSGAQGQPGPSLIEPSLVSALAGEQLPVELVKVFNGYQTGVALYRVIRPPAATGAN